MRSFCAAAVLAIALLIVPVYRYAFATTGNVLLPSDEGSSPDSAPATPSSATTEPEPPAPAPVQMSLPSLNLPSLSSTTPAPPPVSLPKSSSSPPLPPSLPTQTFKMAPVPKILTDNWGKNLPSSLNIGFADGPTLGAIDTQTISSHFGIASGDVTSACSLVLSGNVQSDKNYYMSVPGTYAARLAIKYDGKLQNVLINVAALCKSGQLPTNAGPVIQFGDKYMAYLALVTCPVPAGQKVSQLTINYAGDGKGQCAFQ